MIRIPALDLPVLDTAAHIYTLGDRVIPSVTQILSAVGVSTDFEAIGARSTELRYAIELKRAIGTVVHADCHAWDDGDLDLADVDPLVRPYVDAWITFRNHLHFVPDTRERVVYHADLGYCGTLDAIGTIQAGRRILVDIKTGDPEDAGARFQTAAYQAAYHLTHQDHPIDERWSVELCPDNAIPYRVHPYHDWQDFQKFRAFVTTYHAQRARRTRAC
jgi:hypothetical protein